MIPALLAVYAMSAPGGYLAGDVYQEQTGSRVEWLPIACAIFPPMGAVLAVICLINANTKG